MRRNNFETIKIALKKCRRSYEIKSRAGEKFLYCRIEGSKELEFTFDTKGKLDIIYCWDQDDERRKVKKEPKDQKIEFVKPRINDSQDLAHS